jgi:hypothetical protein
LSAATSNADNRRAAHKQPVSVRGQRMNIKLIGTLITGTILMSLQSIAEAIPLSIYIDGPCNKLDLFAEVETGKPDELSGAIREAVGYAMGLSESCPGTHIVLRAKKQ